MNDNRWFVTARGCARRIFSGMRRPAGRVTKKQYIPAFSRGLRLAGQFFDEYRARRALPPWAHAAPGGAAVGRSAYRAASAGDAPPFGAPAMLRDAGVKRAAGERQRAGAPRLAGLALGLMAAMTCAVYAAPSDIIDSLFSGNAETVEIVLLLTLLSLLPTLLIMMTGFVRVVIVLSFVRNAMGMQNSPPNQVIIGLALFITYFIMSPVLTQINETAYTPYLEEQITLEEFVDLSMEPLREFMFAQTYRSDLDFFASTARLESVDDLTAVPNSVVIPAFLTSELKHAFQIGFFIYIPFIVIDMVVASTLMAMGMMMLPPAMISLPFKILLFVLVDGWSLTIGTLIRSFS